MTTRFTRRARAMQLIAHYTKANHLRPIATYEALVEIFADLLTLLDLLEMEPAAVVLDAVLASAAGIAAKSGADLLASMTHGEISSDVLEARPTITTGWTDDLKIDTGATRYWLARTTIEDGEPYDHRVTIERLIDGRWIAVHTYPGAGH